MLYVYCIVYSPPQIKFSSVTMYLTPFTLFDLLPIVFRFWSLPPLFPFPSFFFFFPVPFPLLSGHLFRHAAFPSLLGSQVTPAHGEGGGPGLGRDRATCVRSAVRVFRKFSAGAGARRGHPRAASALRCFPPTRGREPRSPRLRASFGPFSPRSCSACAFGSRAPWPRPLGGHAPRPQRSREVRSHSALSCPFLVISPPVALPRVGRDWPGQLGSWSDISQPGVGSAEVGEALKAVSGGGDGDPACGHPGGLWLLPFLRLLAWMKTDGE